MSELPSLELLQFKIWITLCEALIAMRNLYKDDEFVNAGGHGRHRHRLLSCRPIRVCLTVCRTCRCGYLSGSRKATSARSNAL